MAPLLGIHPTGINSSLWEALYLYATVCLGVYGESLSTLTHIPLLWHKDRRGSSHGGSQITLVKAEVNKVWVHLNDWLDCCCSPFTNVCPFFPPKNIHIQIEQMKDGQGRCSRAFYLVAPPFDAACPPSSCFPSSFFSSPCVVLFLCKLSITKAAPPHSVFIPPQPHTPSYALVCMCQLSCVFSSFTRIFVVLLPWWLGLFN